MVFLHSLLQGDASDASLRLVTVLLLCGLESLSTKLGVVFVMAKGEL